MVREKSGKSQGILFWAKSQGKVREFCFKMPIAMKICCYSCRLSRMFVTIFTNMKVHIWIFFGFLYFSLFSNVTSAALNTIQISYGISYFRHRDSSDIFTYDIAQQSVVDKMVREISLEVREKSGKSQGILFSHLCGNPVITNTGHCRRLYTRYTQLYVGPRNTLKIHCRVLGKEPVTTDDFITNTGHCRRLYTGLTQLCVRPRNTLQIHSRVL